MIDLDLSDPQLAVISPQGALSEADFTGLAGAIDNHINTTDSVPALVICVDKLPYWDSIGALTRHFHFVQQHHQLVRKVAIVGDSPLLSVAPEIANRFVEATVRRFPSAKLEEAKEWARAEGDDPGRFEPIDGLPSDVIALRVVGVITADDYRDMLIPLMQEKLAQHDKLKCLLVLDDDYATFSGGAAWEDTKFDLRHMTDFSRIALVTDIGWMIKTARLFQPILPYELGIFPLAELEEAKSWIKH
ncbi:STAS/SEC14 domain-containing protein [Aurantiacibacter gilvus]|uniref:STAS/SEC14 domain-containing protein n=1 Tax=Aurantiacibacter gilvus TaxID=3139141 RepID=A0ABU9IFN6_9SPHN